MRNRLLPAISIVASVAILGLIPAGASTAPSPRTLVPPPPSTPSPVPSAYQSTYQAQSTNVTNLANQDGQGSVLVNPSGTTLAAELKVADGNFGTALLASGYMTTVNDELSDLEQMGVKAVVVNVAFPLLVTGFTDSSQYLSFYEQVAQAAHADGMELSIEENPIIPSLSGVSVSSFYGSLTLQSYAADQQQEAQTIIDDMQPQYLDLVDEVSTFTTDIGLSFGTTTELASLLTQELTGLTKSGTKIGAGIGTWESTSLEQTISAVQGIDFLSIHFYPTSSSYQSQIDALNQVTTIAANAHLPLNMDETWLNKLTTTGSPVSGAADEQKLQTFDFWEPLDSQYLSAIVGYAKTHGISLISPFGSNNFFSYVTWTSTVDAETDNQVSNLETQQVAAALPAGDITTVGETYMTLAGATLPSSGPGYWMLSSGGTVYNFGSGASSLGSPGTAVNPWVAMAATPGGGGYWTVTSVGRVENFGSATTYNLSASPQGSVVTIASTADGKGYWIASGNGQVLTAGDAVSYGSAPSGLNKPIVNMVPTPDGKGYWMLAGDGGVFTFGDATFYGSTGNIKLVQPAVAMAPTADGGGYWFVASDGGIFAFGDATYYGSTYQLAPGMPPGGHNSVAPVNQPVNGIVVTADGKGYWMVAADGGVFTFGDAGFVGSLGGTKLASPIVAFAAA